MRHSTDIGIKLRQVVGAFPPPGFLSMPAAAIDISDTSIKYMDTEYTSAGSIPRRFDSVVLPEGIVSGGVVQDVVALASFLKPLQEKHKRAFAFVALPEELAYLYTVNISKTEGSSIKDAVEFSLADNVPIDIQDAVFDFDVIDENSGGTEVSVTAFERTVVEGYVAALERAGFTVRLCELEARSVVRSVIPWRDQSVSMVIDFGRTRTGITIANGQTPIFTTTVHVGGNSITEAIMRYKSISEEEADILKREEGITDNVDEKLRSILTDAVGKLVKEIERHYQFWDSKRDEHGERIDRIDNIYLCGGAASLLGLPEYIAKQLHIPVHSANVWQNMFDLNTYIPPVSRELSWQYATAAGLLLTDIK